MPDLLAGKLHAVLCRRWERRVKGRDLYDLVWYVNSGHNRINIRHLENRMRQSDNYNGSETLTLEKLKSLLHKHVSSLFNLDAIKQDITPFIEDSTSLDIWNIDYFHSIIDRLIE